MEFEIELPDGSIYKHKVLQIDHSINKDWYDWGLFDNKRFWEKYPNLKPDILK